VLSALVEDPRRRAMSVLPEKILVATDGSERAARATRTAAELPEKLGAELHVIHVGEPPVVFHPEMRGYTAHYERTEQNARKLRLRGAPRALPGARRARGRGVA